MKWVEPAIGEDEDERGSPRAKCPEAATSKSGRSTSEMDLAFFLAIAEFRMERIKQRPREEPTKGGRYFFFERSIETWRREERERAEGRWRISAPTRPEATDGRVTVEKEESKLYFLHMTDLLFIVYQYAFKVFVASHLIPKNLRFLYNIKLQKNIFKTIISEELVKRSKTQVSTLTKLRPSSFPSYFLSSPFSYLTSNTNDQSLSFPNKIYVV